jgi:hypothetical protein
LQGAGFFASFFFSLLFSSLGRIWAGSTKGSQYFVCGRDINWPVVDGQKKKKRAVIFCSETLAKMQSVYSNLITFNLWLQVASLWRAELCHFNGEYIISGCVPSDLCLYLQI